VLALHTMRFHDEVVDAGELDVSIPRKGPTGQEAKMAVQPVDSLHEKFDPTDHEDCYRERLERIVQQKKKGERVKAPPEPKQPKPAPDLMEALQATLERMGSGDGKDGRKGRGRKKAAASR
jgi:DNA end-binding protein Ku